MYREDDDDGHEVKNEIKHKFVCRNKLNSRNLLEIVPHLKP